MRKQKNCSKKYSRGTLNLHDRYTFSSNRPFQPWDYSVSHSQFLLRSPKIKGYEENIDVIFFDVEYIQIHTILNGLTIQEIDPTSEIRYDLVRKALTYEQNKLYEINSENETYYIVAGFAKVFESDLEFNESSLGVLKYAGREKEVASIL